MLAKWYANPSRYGGNSTIYQEHIPCHMDNPKGKDY